MATQEMQGLADIIAAQVNQYGATVQQLLTQVSALTQQVTQLSAANHKTQTAGETAYRTLHAQLQATQDRITAEITGNGGNSRGGGGGK